MRMTYLAAPILVAGLSLAGCTAVSASPVQGSAMSATTLGASAGHGRADASCTDVINYAGDPRSNAEINTIGETTGVCPPVEHHPAAPAGTLRNDPTVSCTNRLDYADDPRDNAQINSIGETTGFCPTPTR